MFSRAKLNALANYAYTGVTALGGLIVTPMLLHGLGETTYGSWKALQKFFDFGTAADGGASQSLKWVVAQRSAHPDKSHMRMLLGAALCVLLRWSPLMLVLSAAILVFLPVLISGVPSGEMPELYWTGVMLAANVVMFSLLGIPDAVLVGTNQGYRSMSVTSLVFVMVNFGMVLAANAGLGSVGLAACVTAGTGLNGLLTYLVARRRVEWWGFKLPGVAETREFRRLSGWMLVWGLASRALLSSEVLLLSVLVGAAAVASYTVTSYVATFSLALCTMTTSALMPSLGRSLGAEDFHSARTVAQAARELNLAIVTVTGSLIIMLNEGFVGVWAGKEQFMGQSVNVLTVLALLQHALLRVDSQIQDTGLLIRNKVLLGIASLLLGLGAGFLAFALFGSVEMLLVGMIVGRLVGTISFPILANETVNGTRWPLGRLLAAMGILALATISSCWMEVQSLTTLLVSAVVVAPILLLLTGLLVLSKGTRVKIHGGR